ncbi:hypothetical protein J2X48_000725 [Bosea sp. BE271]|nr:hypothetical protein [Bosea robiniae]MDR6893181.1 hypothetical protein [Bosea sp. BE109]MDR7137120.1 hypothetical protein [Bosea sp. BE168]MDR7173819.1 hypothetical protein [Bosea sp. BE271]
MSDPWRKQQVPTITAGGTGLTMSIPSDTSTRACNCIGPQRGEPYCPCRMRGVIQRDGRWIEPERDLGPVRSDDRLLDLLRNLPADFSDDGNCCAGKLADATPKSNPRGQ